MIKFFRKIRRQLLTENKFTKYLLYAIGEIILVVIGILIALQINNWNEKNKNTKMELLYYCRILDDFEIDKQLISQFLEKSNNRISTSKELLLDLDSHTKDKNYLLTKFLDAYRSDTYVPRNVTFKELISSGNLKFLNDLLIKKSIIQYYSELEDKQFQLQQNRNELIKKTFEMFNTSIEFGGLTELQYVKKLFEPEINQAFPQDDWTKNKESEYYKEFQLLILFNITMAEREKQHLSKINNLMNTPYELLIKKCKT